MTDFPDVPKYAFGTIDITVKIEGNKLEEVDFTGKAQRMHEGGTLAGNHILATCAVKDLIREMFKGSTINEAKKKVESLNCLLHVVCNSKGFSEKASEPIKKTICSVFPEQPCLRGVGHHVQCSLQIGNQLVQGVRDSKSKEEWENSIKNYLWFFFTIYDYSPFTTAYMPFDHSPYHGPNEECAVTRVKKGKLLSKEQVFELNAHTLQHGGNDENAALEELNKLVADKFKDCRKFDDSKNPEAERVVLLLSRLVDSKAVFHFINAEPREQDDDECRDFLAFIFVGIYLFLLSHPIVTWKWLKIDVTGDPDSILSKSDDKYVEDLTRIIFCTDAESDCNLTSLIFHEKLTKKQAKEKIKADNKTIVIENKKRVKNALCTFNKYIADAKTKGINLSKKR